MSFQWGDRATCAICNKLIFPRDSNVTKDGKTVHSACYDAKIKKEGLSSAEVSAVIQRK
jgi:hypothetical protein